MRVLSARTYSVVIPRDVTWLAVPPSGEVVLPQGLLDEDVAAEGEVEDTLDDLDHDTGAGEDSDAGEDGDPGDDDDAEEDPGEDSDGGEDGNADGEVLEPDTGEEQDGEATFLAAQTPPAIRTARRQLATFLAGPRDSEDYQPGRTRQQTRSLQQNKDTRGSNTMMLLTHGTR